MMILSHPPADVRLIPHGERRLPGVGFASRQDVSLILNGETRRKMIVTVLFPKTMSLLIIGYPL